MKNYIKMPMIAAIVLEGIILATGLLVYMSPQSGAPGRTLPGSVIANLIWLLVYIILLLVMSGYDGNSNRTVGIVMTVVVLIICTLSFYIQNIQSMLLARKGAAAVAALAMTSSRISMLTAPLGNIAFALAFIAIGRFGTENEYHEPTMPVTPDPSAFGNGYTIQR